MMSDGGFSCSFPLFPPHLLPCEGPFHFFQILRYSFKLRHFKTHPSSFSFLPPIYRDVCPHQFLMGLQCFLLLPTPSGRIDIPAHAIHPPPNRHTHWSSTFVLSDSQISGVFLAVILTKSVFLARETVCVLAILFPAFWEVLLCWVLSLDFSVWRPCILQRFLSPSVPYEKKNFQSFLFLWVDILLP